MCQPKAGEGRRRWKREECRRAGTGDLKKGEGEKSIIIYLGNFCIEFEKCHSKNAPGSFSAPGKLESFTI